MNDLKLIWSTFPLFLQGVLTTLNVFVVASLLSLFLGLCLGTASSKKMNVPRLATVINGITFCCRAVPFFVQLLIMYFVVPEMIGINFSPFIASVVALALCSSGYVAQFIRGGIDGIPQSQWESAHTLGYSRFETLYHVIFPQALLASLPALNNELEALLKSTSVTSSIGMLELTRVGMNVVSREMEPVPIYLAIAFFYGCLSFSLHVLNTKLEKRFSYAIC